MSPLSFIVSMSIYCLLLYFFLDYTREKEGFFKWFFILALLSFPLWFINLHSFFRWAKSFSVLVPICFVSFIRIAANKEGGSKFMQSLRKKWPLWILYFVLMLNIAEATKQDFELGNYFNAVCGIILCVTIPFPTKHWRIGKKDGKKNFAELIADLPLAWCLLYVTWNACFVYGENTSFIASSICILIVPEIWMLTKKRTDLWLMGRIYTLALHILIRSSYDVFAPVMNSAAWWNADVAKYWGLVNLVLHGGYLIYWFFNLRNKDYVLKHSAQATELKLAAA